jgi:hypothetical protein
VSDAKNHRFVITVGPREFVVYSDCERSALEKFGPLPAAATIDTDDAWDPFDGRSYVENRKAPGP